jgi:hypothetical protein
LSNHTGPQVLLEVAHMTADSRAIMSDHCSSMHTCGHHPGISGAIRVQREAAPASFTYTSFRERIYLCSIEGGRSLNSSVSGYRALGEGTYLRDVSALDMLFEARMFASGRRG